MQYMNTLANALAKEISMATESRPRPKMSKTKSSFKARDSKLNHILFSILQMPMEFVVLCLCDLCNWFCWCSIFIFYTGFGVVLITTTWSFPAMNTVLRFFLSFFTKKS